MGIGPTLKAWEASVLPLNYAREIIYYFHKNSIELYTRKASHLNKFQPIRLGFFSSRCI